MAVKVNLGVSKKVGLPDYGSAGASCNLDLAVSPDLLDGDLEGFHARVRSAYVVAQQAVQEQLQRLQGTTPQARDAGGSADRPAISTNGRDMNGKRHRVWGGPAQPGNAAPRSRKPATDKQIAKIRALVSQRDDTDLHDLLRDLRVEKLADLDIAAASGLIDTLLETAEA